MLEEIGYEYEVKKVDLDKGEQFNPEFKKISPFSKIPVIIDHKTNQTVFESGAILIYFCLLYTSPSPRDRTRSRMPSSA